MYSWTWKPTMICEPSWRSNYSSERASAKRLKNRPPDRPSNGSSNFHLLSDRLGCDRPPRPTLADLTLGAQEDDLAEGAMRRVDWLREPRRRNRG